MTATRPPLHVLVVDDSPVTRTMLQAAVEALADEHDRDVAVDAADGGLSALRLLPGKRYDLILTDINMPDLHGLELIRFVRQHPLQGATPILVISTAGAERDRHKAMLLGATDYLIKPVSLDALRVASRAVWEGEGLT
jgi:two-component system chemotaxis response regulator CheY